MDHASVPVPEWLVRRLRQQGAVSFRRYMDWVLNDREYGAYGTGRLRVGLHGDFVTSSSLGSSFASLLALQIQQWLQSLSTRSKVDRLSLIDVGPGEGDLAANLVSTLLDYDPGLAEYVELILVERNPGMVCRQRQRLKGLMEILPVRWSSLKKLAGSAIEGIIIAHELIDALPVERLVLRQVGKRLHRQTVMLSDTSKPFLRFGSSALPNTIAREIASACHRLGICLPPSEAPAGWTTEWPATQGDWLAEASAVLHRGILLIIDYALEAKRFFQVHRAEGTLVGYRRQRMETCILDYPGEMDLTAHLCCELVVDQSRQQGWTMLGQCRQGEALLALGLAQRLHKLQSLPPSQLAKALEEREALLRLVDPTALGDFRWFALQKQPRGIAPDSPFPCYFMMQPFSETSVGKS
ncbi:SAM-dependent methyltransferase [cyanobiont of Ornithocercus magnificus]|nr:SAM-dependent methyltransferase [cyanobiont of Ornithocercus magnificus]